MHTESELWARQAQNLNTQVIRTSDANFTLEHILDNHIHCAQVTGPVVLLTNPPPSPHYLIACAPSNALNARIMLSINYSINL